jgi:hypothetical protein
MVQTGHIISQKYLNSTHMVVTAPEDTEVRVQCPESPKLVKVIRGQWWLAMRAGCQASTLNWEIVARNEGTVKEETVEIAWHRSQFDFDIWYFSIWKLK